MVEADEASQIKRLKFKFPGSSWHFELTQMGSVIDITLHWNNRDNPTSSERLRPEDVQAFCRFFIDAEIN